MFVEHQSTSGTKIHNPDARARAVLLDYICTEITGKVVRIRSGHLQETRIYEN